MGVGIDHTGKDDLAGEVDDVPRHRRPVSLHEGSDAAVEDGDVGPHFPDLGNDEPAAPEEQVVRGRAHRRSSP